MDTKRCSFCHEEKPLDSFHRQPRAKAGRHSWCKRCYNARHPRKKQLSPERRREANYRLRYGMSTADVAALLEQQSGCCALCGCDISNKRYHVDHDHSTGAVRGILCHRCNIHLPFAEDAEWLRRALAYLGREGGQ